MQTTWLIVCIIDSCGSFEKKQYPIIYRNIMQKNNFSQYNKIPIISAKENNPKIVY